MVGRTENASMRAAQTMVGRSEIVCMRAAQTMVGRSEIVRMHAAQTMAGRSEIGCMRAAAQIVVGHAENMSCDLYHGSLRRNATSSDKSDAIFKKHGRCYRKYAYNRVGHVGNCQDDVG